MEEALANRLVRYQQSLVVESTSDIVRRFITFGDSHIINEESLFRLKAEVADHFDVHPTEVLLVGSAKLGFSIAYNKRYQPFGDSSDIDLALVSTKLFDKIWELVFLYWSEGNYWDREDDFKRYLFRGWIRPDKLPPSSKFNIGKEWWEFFRNLTSTGKYGPYKITGGLYRSWVFFESYQSICVKQCKQTLK